MVQISKALIRMTCSIKRKETERSHLIRQENNLTFNNYIHTTLLVAFKYFVDNEIKGCLEPLELA